MELSQPAAQSAAGTAPDTLGWAAAAPLCPGTTWLPGGSVLTLDNLVVSFRSHARVDFFSRRRTAGPIGAVKTDKHFFSARLLKGAKTMAQARIGDYFAAATGHKRSFDDIAPGQEQPDEDMPIDNQLPSTDICQPCAPPRKSRKRKCECGKAR